MMAADVERRSQPRARPSWVCPANVIMCYEGHPLLYYEAGYRADVRRMLDGHGFFECRECKPPTYFLAAAAKMTGIADVTCYDIGREDYVHWDTSNDPTPPTPELLYHLRDRDGRSHNPNWRPQAPRRT